MISSEAFEKLAQQHQTGIFPNIVREYFQHVFLSELYKLRETEKMLLKGGTALRVIYGSPRFSEDLDFSVFGVRQIDLKHFIETLFLNVLAAIEQVGIQVDVGEKSDKTSGGYIGVATFKVLDYQPTGLEINVSSRNGRDMKGEVDSITNDFVPTYNLIHLPQHELVEEKIFGALQERKKPRDFYDLYFMMRKGMLSADQKQRLAASKDELIADARNINFRGELRAFLPADQQAIIKDFVRALEAELQRQVV